MELFTAELAPCGMRRSGSSGLWEAWQFCRGCWVGSSPCVGVTLFSVSLQCVSDLLMWGDNRDVPRHCWMPVVQKQSKKKKHLLPSSINLSTRGLFGSFTVS